MLVEHQIFIRLYSPTSVRQLNFLQHPQQLDTEASQKTVSNASTTGLICSMFDNIESKCQNGMLEDHAAHYVQFLVGISK